MEASVESQLMHASFSAEVAKTCLLFGLFKSYSFSNS